MILTQKQLSSFENPNELLIFKTPKLDYALGLHYNEEKLFSIMSSGSKEERFCIQTFEDFEIIDSLSSISKKNHDINPKYLEGRLSGEEKLLMDIIIQNFEKNIENQHYLFVNQRQDENEWYKRLSFVEFNKEQPFSRKLYRIDISSHRYSSEPFYQKAQCPQTFLYHLESTLNDLGQIYSGKNIQNYLNQIGFSWIYDDAKKYFKEDKTTAQRFQEKCLNKEDEIQVKNKKTAKILQFPRK